MFYSQIILAKKGPLGKVWLAAHWGDKKIGRTQIFTTDISQSVQDIVNPAAPLSLRVSGHLLLGVVRIYSRKVKYLKNDVEEAAVKMKMTFKGGAGGTKDSGDTDFMVVDLNPNRSPRKSKSMGVNNVVNFGEYDGGDFLSTEMSNRTSILDNPLNLPGVQPVSNDQLLIPFTLDPGDGGDLGFQEWEAVQEEGELGDPLRQIHPFSLDAESIMSGRRAMLRDPTQQSQTDESALEAVNMTLDSEIHNMKHLPTQQDDKEETWESFDQGEIGKHEEEDEDEDRHVFPPDEMLVDDDDNAANMKNSRVSDIEVVRDADSIESVKIGRVSTALSSVGNTNEKLSLATAGPLDSSVLGAPTPIPNDEELAPPPFEEEQDQNLQFDDNSPEPKRRLFEDDTDSLLPSPDATRDSLAIDAPTPLTMASQQEDEASKSQPPPKKKQTRKRKRRRVCFDYDEDELSSAHVKDMIRDPSDIVRNCSHPAEDISSDDEGNDLQGPQPFWRPKKTRRGSPEDIIANLSYEVLFSRPNVADSGKLAPGLLEMWIDNTAPVRNQPLKIRLRGEAGEEQERDRAEQIVKEAAASELENNEEEQRRLEGDDVEITRQEGFQVEEEQRLSIEHPDYIQDKMQEENIEEQNAFPNEEDVPLQFDDDDDQIQHDHHAIEEGPISFEDELDGMGSPTKSEGSNFSLGAVNDMQEEHDDDESPRQERGEDLASAATKWHKHTVKVLDMLKRNMEDRNVTTDDKGEKDTDNQKDLSYDKLSYGVKRRTACGVFFELLQLKTWDFIELKQEESYCDIRISPGVRFHENPPTN